MAIFSYRAVNARGALTEGRLEASDRRSVAARIQDMGLIPVAIDESFIRPASIRKTFAQRITRKDILLFFEELSSLNHAGLPLDRSLSIAAELAAKPAMRMIVLDVLKQIKAGKPLTEALASHPKQFHRLHVNMIKAGEAGGVLDVILTRLVEFERATDDLRGHLMSALIYPALLTTVGLASIAILLFFVIPRFASIFGEMGAQIPMSTQILLALSQWAIRYWMIAVGAVVGIGLAVRYWMKTPGGSRTWDTWKLRVPMLGPTLLKIEIDRFARTLGTLLASSVPLIAAVRIVQDIANNQIIAEGISKIADGAKRGLGVAKPMRDAGIFPGLSVHLVEVGEETGRLDAMLLQLADIYDKDVRNAVKSLTSVFEPAIILVMGLIVGLVVLSMLTAIFSINDIGF